MVFRRYCIAVVVILSTHFAVLGQPPNRAEIVKQAKASTVIVEASSGKNQGTAFCVHSTGLFLTNEHVVAGASEVTLILNPAQKNQQIVKASVVRRDTKLDLALLRTIEKCDVPIPLSLGSTADLVELTEVIAAGFPFGKNLALDKKSYPSVTINVGRVTSLRMVMGELERIQLDAAVNPGNSGGPVLGGDGKVIGIVVSGIRGATLNFAIPVEHARRFMAKPEMQFISPSISFKDRFQMAMLKVRAITLTPSGENLDVELIIGPAGRERTYSTKMVDGVYQAEVTVLPPPPKGNAIQKVNVTFENGSISGYAEDVSLKIGDDEVKLSNVKKFQLNPEPTATLSDGKVIKGKLASPDVVSIKLGTETVKINLRSADELVVEPKIEEPGVDVTVIVRTGKRELMRDQRYVWFLDVPPNLVVAKLDPAAATKRMQGFWVRESIDTDRIKNYRTIVEATGLLVEGNLISFIRSDGSLPPNYPTATFSVDMSKSPAWLNHVCTRGSDARSEVIRAIFKFEGDRLFIATHGTGKSNPTEFSIAGSDSAARANIVTVYRRSTK